VGGTGDLSDNLNAAIPSSWEIHQNTLTISSVSEIYSTAVISIFWAWHSFFIALRFWLPCHISKSSWILANLCKFLSSADHFISKSFSLYIVSSAWLLAANILLLAWVNCLRTTFSRKVSPAVFDYLQLRKSWPSGKLASTPAPCGLIEYTSYATFEKSAYCECVSSC